MIGAAAILPLVFDLYQPIIQGATPLPLPLPALVAVGLLQNVALLALAIGVGLKLSPKIGLGTPLIEAWLYRKRVAHLVGPTLKVGVLTGIAVGVAVMIPLLIAAPHYPDLPFVTASRVSLWKRFLAGFYGGIVEEVLCRLFLLTLIAWLGVRFFQRDKQKLSNTTFWSANIVVAILFGLGHLPSASMVMKITPSVILLALALNGIAAISFGYLYRKRGLEAAMFAHFCADFVIYVVGVAFLRFLPLH